TTPLPGRSPSCAEAPSGCGQCQAGERDEPADEAPDEEVLGDLVDVRLLLAGVGGQLRPPDEPLGGDDQARGGHLTREPETEDEETLQRAEEPPALQLLRGSVAVRRRGHRARGQEHEAHDDVAGGQLDEGEPGEEQGALRVRGTRQLGPPEPGAERPAGGGGPPGEQQLEGERGPEDEQRGYVTTGGGEGGLGD